MLAVQAEWNETATTGCQMKEPFLTVHPTALVVPLQGTGWNGQ